MEEEKKKNGFWEFVKIVVISLAIVFPIRAYVAQPFVVSGESMEPNFSDGQYLIIDEISYRFKEPQRSDVIVMYSPVQPSTFLIKRIIGLPGEEIKIENGNVIITKKDFSRFVLNEDYLPSGLKTQPDSNILIKENEYFVLGDNRTRSSDSRVWGVLSNKNIKGRVLLRLWPINKISLFN